MKICTEADFFERHLTIIYRGSLKPLGSDRESEN
jgi:hypothetical protein